MTTIEETLTKLIELRLNSMAHAVRELMDTAPGHQMSFEEKLGLVVDREWSERDNRRLSRRLKEAKLATRASLDNVLCDVTHQPRRDDLETARIHAGSHHGGCDCRSDENRGRAGGGSLPTRGRAQGPERRRLGAGTRR